MTEKLLVNFNENLRQLDLYVNRLRNSRLGNVSISISEKDPDLEQLALPPEESTISLSGASAR
jgi:hypothetical protein